ncbi:MAG TPA: site-2 protease family protein [Chitinophagaceae bacterium]|nr:site-2 protease family protein [Chitinophagaceae bacterium]
MDNLSPASNPSLNELPKPEPEAPKVRVNVWVKSLSSLALYLIIGYFFFNKNWTLVFILTGVVIFHELGHFFAMKFFNYQELGIFFIPLMGAFVSGTKQEISQKQSAVILMAGPVPGILVGIIFFILAQIYGIYLLEMTAWILIYLNILNLIPVYPLDGGQLLHRLFLDNFNIIGKIFVIISAALMAYFAISINFYPLLLFPAFMISRMITEFKQERLTAKIEAEGIDLMKSYNEISAEDYWHIRNLVIKYYPSLKDVPPSPPYEFSPKEDQVISIIQNLLQRSISQDLSLAGKLFILLIWVGCFSVPLILGLPLRFF